MSDPYRVLGVSPSASDDEVKKAYRALCRKYHPDANINKPNAEQAAAKFTEVQQAYEQIMDERKGRGPGFGGAYGGPGYGGPYGGSQYGGFSGRRSRGSESEYSVHMQAAANYISTRHFREALNVLSGISQRTAEWYYLSALANAGIGNNYAALEQAKTAASMEPGNPAYRNLVQSLGSGGVRYDDMSQSYGGPRGTGSACSDLCMANLCLNLCCNPCC